MGDHWLHALPDHLSEWKLPFNLVDGWRTRSRSSGGFDDPGPLGVVCHHTVSNTSPQNDIHFCINVSDNAPIGTGLFDRAGVFWFHTAGATNTNGRGGPWFMSTGIVPLDSGNRRLAGIEAANNGVGEVWTPQQVENYPILVACILACIKGEFGLPTSPNCTLAHHEWAPDRKTDPSGPSPWGGPGRTLWNMDGFRGAVLQAQLDQNPPPPEPEPEPEPTPTPIPKDDDMPLRACKLLNDDGSTGGFFVGDGKVAHHVPMGDNENRKREAAILAAGGVINVGSTKEKPKLVYSWEDVTPISKVRARRHVGDHPSLLPT